MSTVRDQKQIELKKNPKSPNYLIAWETHVEAYLKVNDLIQRRISNLWFLGHVRCCKEQSNLATNASS